MALYQPAESRNPRTNRAVNVLPIMEEFLIGQSRLLGNAINKFDHSNFFPVPTASGLRSVLEDLNPKTAVISKQAELHPPGNGGRIVVDRAGKAECPSIVVAVPLHEPINLPMF